MLQQYDTTLDPRQKSIDDLESFITTRIQQGEEIIISIDANETINEDKPIQPYSIQSLINNTRLVNLTTFTPSVTETHTRGQIIDFCLVKPNVIPAVKAFTYLPFEMITSMDHRPYVLDLDVQLLFSHSPESPAPLPSRLLKSTMPKRRNRYLQEVQKKLCSILIASIPKSHEGSRTDRHMESNSPQQI